MSGSEGLIQTYQALLTECDNPCSVYIYLHNLCNLYMVLITLQTHFLLIPSAC